MLYYHRIEISEEIDLAKSNNSKVCMVGHYWFLNHGLKFQDSLCYVCHNLTILSLNKSDLIIITVKIVAYCCIIHVICESKAINLFKYSAHDNRGYLLNAYRKNKNEISQLVLL